MDPYYFLYQLAGSICREFMDGRESAQRKSARSEAQMYALGTQNNEYRGPHWSYGYSYFWQCYGMAACRPAMGLDRKSTRLNSSHVSISYAVFCLKKKNIEGVRLGDQIGH